MSILKSQVVAKNSGAAFEVLKGQRIRVAGRSIVDFVAFNLRDLTERFDQARTKTNQVKIFISTGDVLYSKRNIPMMTIVADTFTEGRHDLQKGMCSRKRFEMVAQGQSKRATGLLVEPRSAAAFAVAVRTLLLDPKRRRAMCRSARARVLAQHDLAPARARLAAALDYLRVPACVSA